MLSIIARRSGQSIAGTLLFAAVVAALSPACGSSTTTAPTNMPTTPTPSTTVYSQTAQFPGVYDSQTSQQYTNSLGIGAVQVLDDFTLSTAGTIKTVTWQGQYSFCVPNEPSPGPVATSVFVGIFADKNGAPDLTNQLNGGSYPESQTNETPLGVNNTFTCTGKVGPDPSGVYNYSLALNTPFTAAAGTRYWLEIQPTTPDSTLYWSWNSSGNGNGLSVQIFGGASTPINTDRAFSLLSK